jgi:hypothetical protein
MDNLENSMTPQNTESESPDIQEQYENLHHLVVSILILVLMLSATFNAFLLRQFQFTRTDLPRIERQLMQINAEYSRVSGPGLAEFVKKLLDYGKTHPDFQPILTKYSLNEAMTKPPTNAPTKK